MKKIVYEIGTFILTAFLYAIPILTACSFFYEWDEFLQFVLLVASLIEFLGLCALISDKVRKGE